MEPSRCPFCGQRLTNQAAIKHLHRSQSKFEAELRRVLLAEANAAAAEKIKEEREAAQAKAEKTVRAELERKQATKQRHLERTVERLRDHNEELERRIEDLNAPERGDMREEDILIAWSRPSPRMTSSARARAATLCTPSGIAQRKQSSEPV